MNKMKLIIMSLMILIFLGIPNMKSLFSQNNQNNNLVIKYYLGINFPKYSHPAKLYDEITLDEVEKIKKSQDTMAYYVGFYKNNNLIKFEKYLNNRKISECIYVYNQKGKLININKKSFD